MQVLATRFSDPHCLLSVSVGALRSTFDAVASLLGNLLTHGSTNSSAAISAAATTTAAEAAPARPCEVLDLTCEPPPAAQLQQLGMEAIVQVGRFSMSILS